MELKSLVTRFLKILSTIFPGLRVSKEDDIAEAVSTKETTSRFIFSKSDIRANASIKRNAFMPQLVDSIYETSVFRTSDSSEAEIWEIGRFVENKRKQSLKGRADIGVLFILKQGLSVAPEIKKSGHRLHANIVGWPTEKDERMQIALELANESHGHRLA